ncbi:MAG: WYL domain-containing protein [Chloroflexi bacterium]|nr:WYL domain-containing protein [Chloroflexota bacterium]
MAPKQLRILADWIERPAPRLRSIRQHPCLAAHIALLHAANLLDLSGDYLSVHPTAVNWFHAPHSNQIEQLLTALDAPRWTNTLMELGWQKTIPIDYEAYIKQSLERQIYQTLSSESEAARWQDEPDSETWQLVLPPLLPLWLHFDLRQLGHWSPGRPLTCTPLTIATAVQRGYGQKAIQWMLETAVHQPLSHQQKKQLNQWSRRSQTYQLRLVRLLSVARPEQLKKIARRKRLRAAIHQQISPRHAIVTEDMAPKLEKWLAPQGYPLWQTQPQTGNQPLKTPLSQQWLNARIIIGLGQIISLPFPAPHNLVETINHELSEQEQSRLEQLAQTTVQSIAAAIRGRDSFFPSPQSVPEETLDIIRQSVNDEINLTLCYQALGEIEPTWREVEPLRLEQYGGLYYLHAYCLRAEANRTFRLDRIKELGMMNGALLSAYF